MTTAARVLRGVGALAVLISVVIGVPALLVALGLIPTSLPTFGDIVSTLSARDDGQLLRGVLGAGAWVCWLVFTLATVSETWAAATSRPAPRLPGLGSVQSSVGVLVTAVVVGLSLSASIASPLAAAASAHRPALPTAVTSPAQLMVPTPITLAGSTQPATPVDRNPVYVVQRRDTLWALAEQHLGDPLRYSEIVALNPGAIGSDNRITTGTTLVFPTDAVGLAPAGPSDSVDSSSHTDVLVQPGDSLWSITQEVTGDGGGWPAVWEANAGRVEPGGEVFDDPGLVRAGWTLTVPGAEGLPDPSPIPEGPPAQTSTVPTRPMPTPVADPPIEPTPATSSSATGTAAEPKGSGLAGATGTDSQGEDVMPGVAAVGLASALGAVSLLALGRYRRRQFRHRRPGRLLPRVPEHLNRIERVLAAGRDVDVAWLDRSLRSLVSNPTLQAIPDVAAACLTEEAITLLLASPQHPAPLPWTADDAGTRWLLRRAADGGPVDSDRTRRHAPFPTLVAIGSTPSGEEWFIDLERFGALRLGGDPERAADLLRFIAAELAHNLWSEMLTVAAVGIGSELEGLNPDRLTLHGAPRIPVEALGSCLTERSRALQTRSGDALGARVHALDPDAWAPRVLLSAGTSDEQIDQLTHALSTLGCRAGLAVVIAPVGGTSRPDLSIDSSGALTVPELDLTLIGHQLPAEEAAPLAQLLAHVAAAADTSDSGESATAEDTDDGADADTRPLVVDGLVDSVLPLPDTTYVDTAATTQEDMRLLAPATTAAGRQLAIDLDPRLDEDLTDWNDQKSRRPKLRLLGHVQVNAQGELPQRNPRRQFYTEVVAYLATRPDGATSEQYATALWPDEPDVVGKTKVRQSISVVRTWLGTDDDGTDFLPSGLTAAAGGRYRIAGGLVDADLFRRLRARGLARGADGIADLELALALVEGRPFELPDLRVRGVGGYGWLLDDGSRMDLELAATIVDVAHVVATHHLGNDEPGRAAEAAHVALQSGTFEDVPLLDLVAACDALGNRAEADAYVARILINHDAEVEEDLPPRTAAVLFQRGVH